MTRSQRSVASPHVVCIADFRAIAQRRVPKPVFDYLDGGAEGEVTLRENCRVFEDVTFRPRHAVAFDKCDLRARVLGFDLALPFLLSPVGYSRLMHPVGEVGAARAAGFSALVVTIDTPVAGIRERDFRNGMKELVGGGPFEKLPYLPQILARPGWLASFLLDGGTPAMENVVIPGKGPMPLTDVAAALAESAVTWSDLKWIREHWGGPIVVKGVLTGDDARRAIDHGAVHRF